MYVFVIGLDGTRLMPCKPRKARKLIEAHKAEIYKKQPFTIRLLYKTGCASQPITLGIDTGSQHIGIAVTSENKVLYQAEIELRSTMDKRSLMETRYSYRRSRRYRKTRYRSPKFRFHTKRTYSETLVKRKTTGIMTHWVKHTNSMSTNRPDGWLTPSMQSKVDHHIRWINRFLDVLPPDTKLRLEIARFDMARMKNPEVHNELYQHGPQYDYENLKAYVFDRDHYKCVVCKRKLGSKQPDGHSLKGMMHHITFRSKGATDNPDQLVTVCEYCHTPQAHKEGGVLWDLKEKHKSVQRGLRDATQMNIIRTRLVKAFPDAELTYGNITAADRKKMHLPKSHAGDAVAIAMKGEDVNICEPTVYIKQIRKKKRSLHEATPRKGRKRPNTQAVRNPKNTKSIGIYHIYDTVRFQNETGFISGFTGKSAYVQDFDGNYITMPGKSYKQINLSSLELVKHNNNWIQKTRN